MTMRMPPVTVALAYQTWSDALRRANCFSPDRMTERLLLDDSIPRVVVADSPRTHLSRMRRTLDDPRFAQPGRLHLRPLSWRARGRPSLARVTHRFEHVDRWLARRAPGASCEHVLVTCDPIHAAVASRQSWAEIVYYAWDDWAKHPPFADSWPMYEWSYRQLAAHDVKVCAVSGVLAERIGAPRSMVLPNATVAAEYDKLEPPPAWFSALRSPIAFYVGALEQRVDVSALARLATDLPDWSIVIVGFQQERSRFTQLTSTPNVHLAGPHPRSAALAMAAAADVCLVPHRRTPMTEAMSPLKLYEYLGAGTPVVATDLPPMRGVSERCLLVPPGEALAPAVQQAARLGPQDRADLAAWRAANDWDQRYRLWRDFALLN